MKKILKVIIIIAALISFDSCKVIDLEPENAISSEVAFSTPEKINAAVLGVYDGLQDPFFMSGRSLIYADLLGEDVVVLAFFNAVNTYTHTAQNADFEDMWIAGYETIQRANVVIDGINKNPGVLSPTVAAQYIAEAKFCRALAHFMLCNFYAQPFVFTAGGTHLGVPIVLTVTNPGNIELPVRNTVAQVYAQVIQDLEEAIPSLPDRSGDDYNNVARATKGAAHALLSRVYLYKEDWANAVTHANQVINSGDYMLNPNPGDAFVIDKYTTKESIFSIANNTLDNPNTNRALPMHYTPQNLGGRGDVYIADAYFNIPQFTMNDKRRSMIVIGADNNPYTTKYTDVGNRADWAPVIRYAEILLNKAEAVVEQTNTVDQVAVDLLNEVRNRSVVGNPPYVVGDFANAQALLNAILAERRIELAFEGHRIFDLGRKKKGVPEKELAGGGTVPAKPFGDNFLILGIPQYEIEKNPNLLQNPGF